MQPEFWHQSWQEGGRKTSFTRRDVHPFVQRHMPPASLSGKHVFVPLCGQDPALLWFRDHARHTTGVEFVGSAIRGFVERHGLVCETTRPLHHESGRLTFIEDDLFGIRAGDVPAIDTVWDRASLIAFPDEGADSLRRRYLDKMAELTAPGSQTFLVTLDYRPMMDEPPFSIPQELVRDYYADDYTIETLERVHQPDHRMVDIFNLTTFHECLYRLTRKG